MVTPPLPVLSSDQAGAWDREAAARGIPAHVLMETAGRAVALAIADRFAGRLAEGVLVACGGGNNGGDGWVVARTLHRVGVPVWVTAVPAGSTGLCGVMAALARSDGVREVAPDGPWPSVGLVVDAVLGGGAEGPLRGAVAPLVERLADLDRPVVAVDGPTGLDLTTGVSHGPPPLRADLTVTFGGYRRGHLLARDEVGDLLVADIGFPGADPAWPTLFGDREAAATLPDLPARAHKGNRGRIVVVGGDVGLTGAVRLTARAAFAAGAGLVHLCCPPEALPILASAEPDLQTRPQPLAGPLTDEARALIEQADAVVVGPGLGRDPKRFPLVFEVFGVSKRLVLDADVLTVLQGRVPDLARAVAGRTAVMTPHAGELRTLFPELASSAAVDPWGAASVAADAAGMVVLFKGVPTVIAGGEGPPLTVAAGNPGLATGGSGDMLSGFIATFLAQGVEPRVAAALGAVVMGRAADRAARSRSARALRPWDVLDQVPSLWRSWTLTGSLDPVRPPFVHSLDRPARI